ncbi:glycosyltransferase [Patescibacteria group bacterium]|nr:glycosyltransferase [Patescibacteria group bacterium]
MIASRIKKTLILSAWAPPQRKGGPLMLYNLFKTFPQGSYCFLTNGSGFVDINSSDEKWLPAKYYYYLPIPEQKKLGTKQFTLKYTLVAKIKRFTNKQLNIIWETTLIVITGIRLIKSENIELLVGTANGEQLMATFILHFLTRKPYLILIFDLWRGNSRSLLDSVLAWALEGMIFKSARHVIVNNKPTRDHFKKRYGINSKLIYNSVEVDRAVQANNREKIKHNSTIVFVGSIYWAQVQGIIDLLDAINILKILHVKVAIISPNCKDDLNRLGITLSMNVTFNEVAPSHVQETIRSSGIAFVPMSFGSKNIDIIRTATPAKYTEYLASGVPILVYAPKYSAVVSYAKETGTALTVTEQNSAELAKAIKTLLTNKKIRRALLSKAKDTFLANHNAKMNSLKFLKIVREL